MTRFRTSSAPEINLPLSRERGEMPLHRQLEARLRGLIRQGRLEHGAVLPSTRVLAAELRVSRGVAVEAFEQLVAEGYLVAQAGGQTRVADASHQRSTSPSATRPAPTAIEIDLRPGRPDLGQFPREAWLRSMRSALSVAPDRRLGYPDPRGVPELREALSTYLNRARGTDATPSCFCITAGFVQGLAITLAVLARRGVRRVALEQPSFAGTERVLEAASVTVVPLPVDDAGLQIEALDRARVGAVIVTPAHQYPTGAMLAPTRRTALLRWASRRDGLVIEDDYDAEFRYDHPPIGAIQGLGRELVVYIGTASKVLAPGLRMGWLIVPERLVEEVTSVKRAADMGSPAVEQLALADFLERGELTRHLRRMRPLYRARRDCLLVALRQRAPTLEVTGISAGLHVLAWLPVGTDAPALARAAALRGVAIDVLEAGDSWRAGIVFGYAATREDAIDEGVRRIAELL
jgi:GntR family transcriptional regulator/MocR family aminotransferase